MKIAAILTLVLALLTGIWVIADYSENERNRSRHGTEALGSLSDYSIAQLDRDNDLERQDGFVGVAAIGFLIASLVMFSKTKKQPAS
ncbi:MAG: hypothetical protein LAO78_03440 [Acidobacteriia bacterium]|nr:hypothetical protein [Terriglobia bacterium]